MATGWQPAVSDDAIGLADNNVLINCKDSNGAAATRIAFSAGNPSTELMRIQDNGNVGIGSIFPQKFQVQSNIFLGTGLVNISNTSTLVTTAAITNFDAIEVGDEIIADNQVKLVIGKATAGPNPGLTVDSVFTTTATVAWSYTKPQMIVKANGEVEISVNGNVISGAGTVLSEVHDSLFFSDLNEYNRVQVGARIIANMETRVVVEKFGFQRVRLDKVPDASIIHGIGTITSIGTTVTFGNPTDYDNIPINAVITSGGQTCTVRQKHSSPDRVVVDPAPNPAWTANIFTYVNHFAGLDNVISADDVVTFVNPVDWGNMRLGTKITVGTQTRTVITLLSSPQVEVDVIPGWGGLPGVAFTYENPPWLNRPFSYINPLVKIDESATNRIMIAGNGAVGIGTPAPQGPLQIGVSYVTVPPPTGIADTDYNNIKNAIAAVSSSTLSGHSYSGGTVYLQAGTYVVNKPIHLYWGMHFEGAGFDKTVIKMVSPFTSDASCNSLPVILLLSWYSTVKNMRLDCDTISQSIAVVAAGHWAMLENVEMLNANIGIVLSRDANTARNLYIHHCDTGIVFSQWADIGGSEIDDWSMKNTVYGAYITECKVYGVHFKKASYDNILMNVDVEVNYGPGMLAGVYLEYGQQVITGCYFENNDGGNVKIAENAKAAVLSENVMDTVVNNTIRSPGNGLNTFGAYTGAFTRLYKVLISTVSPSRFIWTEDDWKTSNGEVTIRREINCNIIDHSGTACVQCNSHGLSDIDIIYITNSNVPAYNGRCAVTVVDGNSFLIDRTFGGSATVAWSYVYSLGNDVFVYFDSDSFPLSTAWQFFAYQGYDNVVWENDARPEGVVFSGNYFGYAGINMYYQDAKQRSLSIGDLDVVNPSDFVLAPDSVLSVKGMLNAPIAPSEGKWWGEFSMIDNPIVDTSPVKHGLAIGDIVKLPSGDPIPGGGSLFEIFTIVNADTYTFTLDRAASNPCTTGFSDQTNLLKIRKGNDDPVLNVLRSGNVGIGITNPQYKLHVNGDMLASTQGNSMTQIGCLDLSQDQKVNFMFGDGNNTLLNEFGKSPRLQTFWGLEIFGNVQSTTPIACPDFSYTGPSLTVHGSSSGAAPDAPVLVIKGTTQSGNLQEWRNSSGTALGVVNKEGKVGIGVTSPRGTLDVNGPVYVQDGTNAGMVLVSSGNANYIQSAGAGMAGAADLHFTNLNATQQWMTILGSGKVGIGTATPAYLLDVSGGDARVVGPRWTQAGDLARMYIGGGQSGIASVYEGGFRLCVLNANSGSSGTLGPNSMDAVTILETSGNMGIGTTTPTSLLEISKDAPGDMGPIFTLNNKGGSGNTAIYMNGYDVGVNSPTAAIKSLDDINYSSHITFSTKVPGGPGNALQERVRIQSDGNVVIGTMSTTQKLSVNGNIAASSGIAAGPAHVSPSVSNSVKWEVITTTIGDATESRMVYFENVTTSNFLGMSVYLQSDTTDTWIPDGNESPNRHFDVSLSGDGRVSIFNRGTDVDSANKNVKIIGWYAA